jgi:hypothetical protein
VFAAQAMGDLGGETAESLAIRVYHEPFLRYATRLCTISFHLYSAAGVISKKEREYYTKQEANSSIRRV